VLSFIAIEIFADVHQAVFASTRPNQHLESQKQKAPSKIKSRRLLKRETYMFVRSLPWTQITTKLAQVMIILNITRYLTRYV
jgi:hypothetical protein